MSPRLIPLLSWAAMLILVVSPHSLEAQTVSDSAGIRLVRYSRSAAPIQRWTIDSKPLLEIGGSAGEGPSEFAEIRGVVRFTDGRIAVANGATNEIRIFSSSGAFQVGAGRAGQGPEFRFAERVPAFSRLHISSSDELWVSEFDPSTNLPGPPALHAPPRPQRWSVFSLDGRWLCEIALPAHFVAYDMGRDYVAGVSFDADGVERVTVLRVRR